MSTAVKTKKRKKKLSVEQMHLLKERQQQLYFRNRRKQRRQQMRLNRIKNFIRLSIILFIFIGFVYLIFLPQWKLSPLVFANYPNKNLLIKDNFIVTDSEILDKLKQIKLSDQPLFFLNTGNIEKKLRELDPVKKVIIRRYWLPARLSITIIEKDPVFLVYSSIGAVVNYAITQDGSVIGKKFLPLPQYYSKNLFSIIYSGNHIKWNKNLVTKFENIVKITEKASGERVEYINLTNPGDVYIKTTNLLLHIGDLDASSGERISRLNYIMPKIENIKGKIEYVNLQWDKALTIKEKSATKAKPDTKESKNTNDMDTDTRNNTGNLVDNNINRMQDQNATLPQANHTAENTNNASVTTLTLH